MELGLGAYLTFATLLFGIGAIGFLVRRSALIQLMCIELMLNAVNVVLVAANRFHPNDHVGQVFAFFVIAVAAAEAAVGLAIILALYRVNRHIETDRVSALRN